jgi:uncharacterized protein (TIGR00251 family)
MTSRPENSCILKIRVQPKSSSNRVLGYEDGIVKLRVTAPPIDGQANAGVISLLAKTLGISKSKLQIIRGESSRDKVIAVEALTEQEVANRIESEAKP